MRYKGINYYVIANGYFRAQAGYEVIGDSKTVGGIKSKIRAYLRREEKRVDEHFKKGPVLF